MAPFRMRPVVRLIACSSALAGSAKGLMKTAPRAVATTRVSGPPGTNSPGRRSVVIRRPPSRLVVPEPGSEVTRTSKVAFFGAPGDIRACTITMAVLRSSSTARGDTSPSGPLPRPTPLSAN